MSEQTQNQPDMLLRSLQEECLKDNDHDLSSFLEAISSLPKGANEAIHQILRICHGLKGNLQAVGFLHCASFVHSLETSLQEIEAAIKAQGGKLPEGDVPILEFFLSDCLQSLQSYYNSLRQTLTDSEELLKSKSIPLKLLAEWRPTPTEANLAPARAPEQAAPPEPEVTKPAAAAPEASAEPPAPARPVAPASGPTMKPAAADISRHKKELTSSTVYLICKNTERFFAIPVDYVIEILASQPLNPLPINSTSLEGLINVRGEPLPVLKMSELWGTSQEIKARNRYVIISQVEQKTFGFQVEEVCELRTIDPSTFQANDTNELTGHNSMIEKIALQNERPILILELDKVMAA